MFDPVTLATIAGGLGQSGMFGGGGESSHAESTGYFTTGDLIGGSKYDIPIPLLIGAGFIALVWIITRSK